MTFADLHQGELPLLLPNAWDVPSALALLHLPAVSVWSDFNHCHRRSGLFSAPKSINVQLNMSERENGQLPLAKRTVRNRISSDIWEQIKTGYAAGINLREIARKMNIPEGTVLAHAKRHGWTQQIQVATRELSVMQSDAIAPVQSVPQSIAAILGERKDRTKLGLSKYAAEAAEQAAEHRDKLGIAGKVRDVSAIHSSLWPEESRRN